MTVPTVLTDGKTKIGAYKFRDRKNPCLCIEEGNEIVVYGTFKDKERADEFMNRIAQFVCAIREDAE